MKTSKLILRQLLLFSLVLSLASCASWMLQYKNAQDAFNEAAEMENRQIMSGDDLRSVDFNLPYVMISDVINSQNNKLKSEGLLGSAYTLQALAAWKSGRADIARSAARSAATNLDKGMYRDKTVMNALPGLIEAEEAFNMLNDESSTFCDISTKLSAAYQTINESRNMAPAGHPVQKYLILNQLAIFASLGKAGDKLPETETDCGFGDCLETSEITRFGISDCVEKYAGPLIEELKQFEGSESLVDFWNDRLFGTTSR